MTDTVFETDCGKQCKALYDAIQERMLGRKPASVSHRGRSVSYADTPVDDMVKIYIQMRSQCAEARAKLPELKPLDQFQGQRGRALGMRWR